VYFKFPFGISLFQLHGTVFLWLLGKNSDKNALAALAFDKRSAVDKRIHKVGGKATGSTV
jgi:hypothetical protein